MANLLQPDGRIGMKRTRDEVAALIEASAKTLRDSQQIHERLRALMRSIEKAQQGKRPVKRKASK